MSSFQTAQGHAFRKLFHAAERIFFFKSGNVKKKMCPPSTNKLTRAVDRKPNYFEGWPEGSENGRIIVKRVYILKTEITLEKQLIRLIEAHGKV